MNHGFIDGNKRVAFACLDIFVGLNGARLEAGPDEVIAFIYRHLEAGTFRKPALEEWLCEHVFAVERARRRGDFIRLTKGDLSVGHG